MMILPEYVVTFAAAANMKSPTQKLTQKYFNIRRLMTNHFILKTKVIDLCLYL